MSADGVGGALRLTLLVSVAGRGPPLRLINSHVVQATCVQLAGKSRRQAIECVGRTGACRRCGHDLINLPLAGYCTQCGTDVRRSVPLRQTNNWRLVRSSARLLAATSLGLTLVGGAIALAALWLVVAADEWPADLWKHLATAAGLLLILRDLRYRSVRRLHEFSHAPTLRNRTRLNATWYLGVLAGGVTAFAWMSGGPVAWLMTLTLGLLAIGHLRDGETARSLQQLSNLLKGVDPGDDGPISRLVGLRSRLLGTVLALLAGVAGVVATFGLTREPEHAFLMMLFALPALGVAVYLAFVWLATVGQLLALVVRTR